MDTITRALAEQHQELDDVLSSLEADDWTRPSRCPGWTIADVVLHLAQTDELALASGQGRLGEAGAMNGWTGEGDVPGDVDEAAARAVEHERGLGGGLVVHQRWRSSSTAMRVMFAVADPGQRLRWVAGELAARTLATTRLAEAWIHTGDVMAALALEQPPTDRLWHIARLAWRTLPYAFARGDRELAGPVGLDLVAPDGSRWEFGLGAGPVTVVRGPAVDFCLVAGQRLDPAGSGLSATGPDAAGVLALVRTFA